MTNLFTTNDAPVSEPDPDFFSNRGVPEEIWKARPYVWWTPECPEPAQEPFADLSPHQRSFVSKLVHQSPGWLITRQPPPMFPPLPRIYPELRPLNPVRTQGPNIHWHGDGPEPEGLLPWQRMTGDPTNHVSRAKYDDDHHGTNTEALHSHQAFAKYVFVSSPKMDGAYAHDHDTSWKKKSPRDRPAYRQAHVAKYHDGLDAGGLHTHAQRVKDSSADDGAKRIDVHPLAVESLFIADVFFFVIEGCIKADAVLADGGAVFSVPSVSLWDCVELPRFAEEYLFNKTVVIVPDADWKDNPAVINQARMCQIALYRLGVHESHVAAPPATYNGLPTKGVDDFIGAGGHLEDLRVIDSDPPAGLHDYIAERASRWDQARRDEGLLMALSCYSGPDGVFQSPRKTLARVIGMNVMTVSRAVKDLERLGAIVIDGDLRTKLGWFSHRWEWNERPTITLIPELRSTDRPE